MTTYICTLYYPPGDTHDLPRSVLLPSGPIKRPIHHFVATGPLPVLFRFKGERGVGGGGGGEKMRTCGIVGAGWLALEGVPSPKRSLK